MKLSVITVHYNDLPGLRRTAISVARQVCPPSLEVEWVVQDAATPDFWRSVRSEWRLYEAASLESRPDGGIYCGMNIALSRATGDYAIFMNAGDEFFGDSALIDFVEQSESGAEVLVGAAAELGPGTPLCIKHPRSSRWALRYGMPTHHQAIYYRRSTLLEFPFDTQFRIAADYDQLLRILYIARRKVVYSKKVVCVFSLDGVSTRSYWKAQVEQSRVRVHRKCSSWLVEWPILLLKKAIRLVRDAAPGVYGRMRYQDAK